MAEAGSAVDIAVQADDGHRWTLLARIPAQPHSTLLWLPALGVAAKHYLPFAEALAASGVAVFVHEWRGNGSSNLRAARDCDWGYRELLVHDLPASEDLVDQALPDLPRIVGGHSLGGQLACCRLAISTQTDRPLWLVGSGSPYWRAFPSPVRYVLPAAYRFLPWLSDRVGTLPGRRIGFGGNEARGVIGDWARTAITGHYAAAGLGFDLEPALSKIQTRVSAVVLQDDWLAPESSLRFLLAKFPASEARTGRLDAPSLGCRADHFSWMKQPQAIVDRLLRLAD